MAKEEKTEEEVKAEAAKAEEAKTDEANKDDSPEVSQELLDAQAKFDDKMDSDDDDPAVDDDEDGEKAKAKAAAEAKEDADGDPAEEEPGEEEAGEQTAEDKELQAAADVIEKEAEAEAGKTDAQRMAEAEVRKADDAAAAKATEDAKEKPYDCGLDPEEYDAGYIKAMNEQGQRSQDENKALKADNDDLRSMVAQQANQRYADWLDRKINGLGDEFTEALGEGEFDDLTPGSEQSENRMKLGRRMGLIAQAHQRLNKAVPPRNKLFDQAVSYEFKKEKTKSKTDAKTAKKLKERSGQTLGKGSQKASASSAADKALRIQKDFDRKLDEDD